MLLVDCAVTGARMLVWTSSIQQVRNLPDAIEVRYECSCGRHEGVWRTARKERNQRDGQLSVDEVTHRGTAARPRGTVRRGAR